MTSILKVDTIQDTAGNNIINESGDTITIGASGDTITIPSGATMTVPNGELSGQNYPAFEAYIDGANQNITTNVTTKAQFNTEVFDTDNCYDNSTNYRFTPNVAGKYYVYAGINGYAGSTSNFIAQVIYIYKNGALYKLLSFSYNGNNGEAMSPTIDGIIDMNGTSDYLEIFGDINNSSGTPTFIGSNKRSYFGAYRLGA